MAPAAAVFLMFSISACSNSNMAELSDAPLAGASENRLVTVERGDLESIVVVSGVVEANPEFLVSVGASGTLSLNPGVDGDLEPGKVLGQVGGQELTVKHRSFINTWLVQEGQFTAKNSPVALAKYSGYGIALAVPPDQLYRIYETPTSARANIESGPGGVKCALVPAEAIQADASVSLNLPALCLLPIDTELVEGLPAQVGLATGNVQDGLIIPVSSVLGTTDWGRVSKADENGNSEVVDVELGVSDGVNIEILSGLKEGDRVFARAPRLYQ